MKNNAKKFPLPTGEQWARLPERVLALETAPKPKIFRATLFQEGFNDPQVTSIVENTTGSTFSFKYGNSGVYKVKSTLPLFTSREKVIVTLSAGKYPIIPAYNYDDENNFNLSTFDSNGSQSDDLLVDNLITIEILD
jgi:hypothetical protein